MRLLQSRAAAEGERAPARNAQIGEYRCFMVLPVRIELTTSPLPRGCSTTELRQHQAVPDCGYRRGAGAKTGAILATRLPQAQPVGMSERPKQQKKQAAQRRLAAALRDNLKRRKAQARGRPQEVREKPHDSAGIEGKK